MFSTYNKSVKIMFDLPYDTHRFLIEPLTGLPHVSRILVKRYISFIEKVRNLPQRTLQNLLRCVQSDVRIMTGSNLRTIMILEGKNKIEELGIGTVDFDYHQVKESDAWRINFVQELVELKHGGLHVPGMEYYQLQERIYCILL